MWKFTLAFIFLFQALTQFTSYVPSTHAEPPSFFSYGSYPHRNPFDSYSPPEENHRISNEKRLRYNEETGLLTKSNNPSQNKFSFGSNIQVANQNDDQQCEHPRVMIDGICKCPDNGVYLSGTCYPRYREEQPCYYPRTLIDGKCICPDNLIYTKEGYCVQQDLSNPHGDCKPPKILVYDICACPDHGILVSGECFVRDDDLQFPTQPIGKVDDPNSISGLALIYRNYDGANNNKNNRLWGSKGSILERRSFANYENGKSEPVKNLPEPRQISNKIGHIHGHHERSRNNISMGFVIWGQFLDHDLDLTTAGKEEAFNIEIPPFDEFFQNQEHLNFHRSHFVTGSQPRQHRNSITAWIDGSQIYGSDETTARYLRMFEDGKLRSSSPNLLPKQDNAYDSLFIAGDIRVNQNIFLTSYHTIFMREHNRVCSEIYKKDASLNDEQIYQAARNYVIGLLQKITFDDFLPIMLGSEYQKYIGHYTGYKQYVNPNIPTQFSTAAYRIGHALIVDVFPLINKFGYKVGEFHLKDMFFRPNLVNEETIDNLIRGLSVNKMKQKNVRLVDSIRNLLVEDPKKQQVKLDLYSLNIQRGRDHGLPSYNDVRHAFGLPKLRYFYELTSDSEVARKLSEIYDSINDLDLIVGIFAQDHVSEGVLGELGAKIVGQTFRNLRDGDRFWYEGAYPDQVVKEIKWTTFSDVLKRNTEIDYLPDNFFKAS